MKATFKLTVIFSLLLLLVHSCKDESSKVEDKVGLVLSAGIKTRAIDKEWHPGDCVGLTAFRCGTNVLLGQHNCRYTTSQGDGYFYADEQNTIYYPLDGSEIDLTGYYPYNGELREGFIYNVDVKSQLNRPAIDLMTFGRFVGASRNKANVEVTFKHRLTKLLFNFRLEDNTQELHIRKLEISGMKTTGSYNLMTEALTVDEESEQTLTVLVDDAKAAAIVLPREAGAGISFTITLENGTEYVVHLHDEQELKSGYKYVFNILLRGKETSPYIKGIIQDWEDGSTIDFDARAVSIEHDPGQSIGFSQGNVIKLYHENEEIGSYTYNGNRWVADYPLYWENIGDGSSEKLTIRALFTRTNALDDTQLPEYFLSEQEVTRFDILNFHFTLIPSQIKFILHSTGEPDETFSLEELSQATIRLPEYLMGYSMTNGVFTVDNSTGDIVVVNHIALIIPQQKDKTLAIINLNGHSYAVSTEEEIDFLAGKMYTIRVNMLKTQTIHFQLTYTDWEDGGETNTEAKIVIEQGTGTTTGFNDGDKVNLYHEQTELATYIYNAATKIWESAAPLYWENIGDGRSEKLTLKAMYTRTDALNDTQMPEVMLVEKEVTRFQPISLHFNLVPAKVVFELHSDGSFAEDELKNKTSIELHNYVGDYTLAYGTFTPGADATSVVKVQNFTALIVPQQSSDLLAVIMLNGNEYVVKKDGGINFEAGKAYTIKVKINKSGVGFLAMSYTDWVDAEGGVIEVGATPVNLDATAGTTTQFKEGEKVTLYHEQTELGIYTYQGSKWTIPAPLYWENIGNGVSEEVIIHAIYHRADALNTSQMPEVMLAETTAKRFQGVSLQFGLTPAKVIFKLKSESEPKDENQEFSLAELNTATIALPNYKTNYSLDYAQYVPKEGTGTITVHSDNAGTFTALLMPQTQTATIATITLLGNTYMVNKPEDITYNAGRTTTIEVNITKTKVASISASYTDWTDNDEDKENLTAIIPTKPGETEKFVAGSKLSLYYDNASSVKTKICDFKYNASNIWEPESSVYWENLAPLTKYNFYATSTLSNAPENSNQMDDVMYAEWHGADGLGVDRFGDINLNFAKKTTRIFVNLTSNDGSFTEDELGEAEITLPDYKIGAKYSGIKYEGFTGTGIVTASKIESKLTWVALIEPQSIDPNKVLINICIKGNNYQIKKTAITSFSIATTYTYTINLSKTGIDFSTNYTDWKEGPKEDPIEVSLGD